MEKERRPKILIVDDEDSARSTLEALLYSVDYKLRFAKNAAEALDALKKDDIDLILLDVMMPVMDGLEACRVIKSNNSWCHIPIILVTALQDKEDLKRGLGAGADDFISKPVNGVELRARVRSMLRIKTQYDRLQGMLDLREDLANMIVHDMRNPLTTIQGYVELMQGSVPKEQKKDVEIIISETHRLNNYLSDLLYLAKMESEKLIVRLSKLDISLIIDIVIDTHRILASAQNITITKAVSKGELFWQADKNLIQKCLDNLVGNAIKYGERNTEVLIRANLLSVKEGQPSILRLEVADKGPGIPPEYRESIFDKYKILQTKKEGVRQIGLGLAFCKLAVEAHGGRIWVEPNYPNGSIFIFEL